MLLQTLHITNFKNLLTNSIDLNPEVNCFVGENGSGKTNLLDAIHFLCLTKSVMAIKDEQAVTHGKDFFRITANGILNSESFYIECMYSPDAKKVLRLNGQPPYAKLSQHIGKFPIVFILPEDTDLIRDGGEIRRKFFDGIISQLDQTYLSVLITYNYLLKQRNALLKETSHTKVFNLDLFEPYNHQLINLGKRIASKRNEFLQSYRSLFIKQYAALSSGKEVADIFYESEALSSDFDNKFRSSFERDVLLQRTTQGIHTDDYVFIFDNIPVKKFASQGQKKTFVLAMKLAQFDLLWKDKKVKPIMLMDDIFDKLDEVRIQKLIEMIESHYFGQLFITDPRPERSRSFFNSHLKYTTFFHLSGGIVTN